MPEPTVYLNGHYVNIADAKVSILDRGLLFGEAIYEVVRVHKGRLFRLDEHYRRMCCGLKAIRIRPPFTPRGYARIFEELTARNGVRCGYIYMQVTRGAAPERDHRLPQTPSPTVFAWARQTPMPGWVRFPNGVATVSVPDPRWQRCDIKTTMLLANTLAKQHAADAGAFEAIFVAEDGTVREGSSTSVFAVLNGVLRTHPANHRILPSITRTLVLEAAREAGIGHREEAFSYEEMLDAAEVFLASTTCDVCPIATIDGHKIGKGVPGPMTKKLLRLFAKKLG